MERYFTYATQKSYQRYVTLNYFPSLKPSQSIIYKSYSIINSNEKLDPSLEPTEFIYYGTNYPTTLKPTLMPTLAQPPKTLAPTNLNYTCICKTEPNENQEKIVILIVATSLTSFACVLLILFIIWYRFFFKRKLMNKNQNNKLFLEKFGVDLSDLNDI
jgi:hypothetical protein